MLSVWIAFYKVFKTDWMQANGMPRVGFKASLEMSTARRLHCERHSKTSKIQ